MDKSIKMYVLGENVMKRELGIARCGLAFKRDRALL